LRLHWLGFVLLAYDLLVLLITPTVDHGAEAQHGFFKGICRFLLVTSRADDVGDQISLYFSTFGKGDL